MHLVIGMLLIVSGTLLFRTYCLLPSPAQARPTFQQSHRKPCCLAIQATADSFLLPEMPLPAAPSPVTAPPPPWHLSSGRYTGHISPSLVLRSPIPPWPKVRGSRQTLDLTLHSLGAGARVTAGWAYLTLQPSYQLCQAANLGFQALLLGVCRD